MRSMDFKKTVLCSNLFFLLALGLEISASHSSFAYEDCVVTLPNAPDNKTCELPLFDPVPRRLEYAEWSISTTTANNGSLAGCGVPDGYELPSPFGEGKGDRLPAGLNPYPILGYCKEVKAGGCTQQQVAQASGCKIKDVTFEVTSCKFCSCTPSGQVSPDGKRDHCCTRQIYLQGNTAVCGCTPDNHASNFTSDCCSKTRGFDGLCRPSPFPSF